MAATDDSETAVVREGLLFIAGSDLWSSSGQGGGATNYSSGSSISNYYEWIKDKSGGSSTNIPDGEGGGGDGDGGDDGEDDSDKNGKIIYVDQAIGNDQFTGRTPHVSVKKGPKKTVRGGLSVAGTNDTIIIRSGTYNENLNVMGKDVKVFIEGNVKL